MRPHGSPEELERRRQRAIELLEQGHFPVEVARALGVDRRSVRRWKAAHRKGGLQALRAKQAPGRPAELDTKQKGQLEKALLKGAQAAGFPSDLWTCPRVRQLIARRFGVPYHVDHIGRLLHSLGWSPQKPARRAIERNETIVQNWIKHDGPGIKKASRLRASLVFVAESGLLMAPLLRRSWSPRGKTPVLYQRMRSHQHVSVIAAFCIGPNRDRTSLYIRLPPRQSIRAPQVRDFLRQLTGHLEGPVVLIWDRLAAHRSRIVHRWLEYPPGLHVEFLPPYAPELNPVEYLWFLPEVQPSGQCGSP